MRNIFKSTYSISFIILLGSLLTTAESKSQELQIGTATADISPKLPVALMGQFHLRMAQTAETPLLANIVALESRDSGKAPDYVIFVACDIVVIPPAVLAQTREELKKRLPELDVNKVILTATHTHTAPVMDTVLLKYPIPPDATQIEEYNAFFVQRVADGVVKAWNSKQPGSVTWGLSYAVVGHNRRSTYANGKSSLYGGLNTPLYRGPEGPEDNDINTLFFWNKKGKLIAMNITVGCPAQEVENREAVNADYWHEARLELKKRFGNDITVVGWISAAGDQAPRMMFNQKAEERMHKLRNVTRLQEEGRRVANAVQDAYEAVKNDKHTEVTLVHSMDTLMLPMRKIDEAEYAEARTQVSKIEADLAANPSKIPKRKAELEWYRSAAIRFENQYKNPKFPAEIHAIRLGNAVIFTNPFEMFTEFGVRILGRSKAEQTFVVQLAGAGNYLTTERAVKGGGYSVIMQSSFVGSEGGDIIVDRGVSLINSMWPQEKK